VEILRNNVTDNLGFGGFRGLSGNCRGGGGRLSGGRFGGSFVFGPFRLDGFTSAAHKLAKEFSAGNRGLLALGLGRRIFSIACLRLLLVEEEGSTALVVTGRALLGSSRSCLSTFGSGGLGGFDGWILSSSFSGLFLLGLLLSFLFLLLLAFELCLGLFDEA